MFKNLKGLLPILLALGALGAPARGDEPIRATLVVSMTPEFHSGFHAGDDDDDALIVNHALRYPFRMETPGFQVNENDLGQYFLGKGAPIALGLELRWEGGWRENLPVSFNDSRKNRNFFTLLTKYRIHQEQTAYRNSTGLRRLFNSPYMFSDRAVDDSIQTVSFLNCYTFAHFIHFSETMGFWPFFDGAKWREIPGGDLGFGDLVRITDPSLGAHFMLHLGRGLYLSKLGWTEELIVTDLDNILKLYSLDSREASEVTAFRAAY